MTPPLGSDPAVTRGAVLEPNPYRVGEVAGTATSLFSGAPGDRAIGGMNAQMATCAPSH